MPISAEVQKYKSRKKLRGSRKRTYSQAAILLSMAKTRREIAKKKYGYKSPQYIKVNSKCTNTRNYLLGLQRNNNIMWEMEKLLEKFVGYRVRHIDPLTRSKEKMAILSIFCKVIMEKEGIGGGDISMFLNCHEDTPANRRRKFTKSLQTNKFNKEMWRRYKLFINEIKEDKLCA